MLKDLHAWHDIADSEGVKIWYVRRSLEEAVEKLTVSIEKLGERQEAATDVLKEMARDMREIREGRG